VPTIYTLARLAEAVYVDSPQVEGWARAAFKPQRSSVWEGDGFQGAAFTRADETVFAFAGTDPSSLQDIAADVKLGMGMNTGQYEQAGRFLSDTLVPGGNRVCLCGHSLGGAIAQIIGNRRRLPFATFNAPGVAVLASRNIDQMAVAAASGSFWVRVAGMTASAVMNPGQAIEDVGSAFYRVRGANFRLHNDVVGKIGVHYGEVIQLNWGTSATDVLANHSMASMLEALDSSTYKNLELQALA